MRWNYEKDDLLHAIQRAGIQKGDALYMHIAPLNPGFAREVMEGQDITHFFYDCIHAVIGDQGTLITPVFSYSFCNNQIYDPDTTPSLVGSFGEWFRKQPGVLRSDDPVFSLAAKGPLAEPLFAAPPNTCFGKDCVYERMAEHGVKICNIGLSLHYTTALYHLQWRCGTPYRFDKLFTGLRRYSDGSLRKESWIYYVRALADETCPDFQPMHDLAVASAVARCEPVGSSFVVAVELREFYSLCEKEFRKNPWCATRTPEGCDILARERARTGVQTFSIEPPASPAAKDIIASVWNLPRDIVSDGYDAALETLAAMRPMKIHTYTTGEPAFTWIIPERWICRSARLEKTDGTVLFSTDNTPLCCMRYSLPFEGEVSRGELMKHLYSSVKKPDAVPYIFKYYERDWGLCIPDTLKQSLSDSTYKVVIDTAFSMGQLKAGEAVLEGESGEHILLCAHLCHPCQVSDGLSGVAVGMEILGRLGGLKKRRYTYHLLVIPETVGSAAWCSHNEALLPHIKGGIFLEMLSDKGKLIYKNSAHPDSGFDQLVGYILETEYNAERRPCYTAPLNDERMFNSTGVNVPMMAVFRRGEGDSAFYNYHTTDDNITNIDIQSLNLSVEAVYNSLCALENNYIPVPKYKGELFCSRIRGIDYEKDCESILRATFFLDGKNSVLDICKKGNIRYSRMARFLDVLLENNLIDKRKII